MSAREFTFYIRQLPGPENALGVVKFPLQNPWAIYMHDTNEKQLFGESKRHRSSGCVRLKGTAFGFGGRIFCKISQVGV